MKRRGAGTIGRGDVGKRVLLEAWVHRRRDLGGVIFLQLRDRSGIVQVVVRPEEAAEVARVLGPVRLEWVVRVEGEVSERSPETVNPEMATGEVEIVADGAAVLSRSEPLPLDFEGDGEATEETRLRYRYLDIRRTGLQRNLVLRHRVTMETLKHFDEHRFVHVETPILTRSTPEGARDYLVPSRVRRGSFYALPQSPQLFKQILMVAGLERYVQIARCFRDEDLRADRQPEFTQVDVEMSFPDLDELFGVIEGLFARLFALVDEPVETPFPRMTWAEAMARYGTDRPDLRFGMEIADLTDILGDSEFRAFRGAVAEGGVVRGIVVPGAGEASRRQVDEWVQVARREGAAGALTLRRRGGPPEFQVKGVLSEDESTRTAGRLGLGEGDLALLVAGPAAVTAPALGALRLEAARELGLVAGDRRAFTWVTEFPLVEWDQDEGRWFSCHHPFTAPDPRDLDLLDEDPGAVRALAYDVVLDGVELGGGSIRIHEPGLQERVFGMLGIGREEARSRFGFLLDALRYGAPPHGGLALGLDRIVMMVAGADSLREVIAFPKTTSATCLMTEAPSPVDDRQLGELGIAVARPPGSDETGDR